MAVARTGASASASSPASSAASGSPDAFKNCKAARATPKAAAWALTTVRASAAAHSACGWTTTTSSSAISRPSKANRTVEVPAITASASGAAVSAELLDRAREAHHDLVISGEPGEQRHVGEAPACVPGRGAGQRPSSGDSSRLDEDARVAAQLGEHDAAQRRAVAQRAQQPFPPGVVEQSAGGRDAQRHVVLRLHEPGREVRGGKQLGDRPEDLDVDAGAAVLDGSAAAQDSGGLQPLDVRDRYAVPVDVGGLRCQLSGHLPGHGNQRMGRQRPRVGVRLRLHEASLARGQDSLDERSWIDRFPCYSASTSPQPRDSRVGGRRMPSGRPGSAIVAALALTAMGLTAGAGPANAVYRPPLVPVNTYFPTFTASSVRDMAAVVRVGSEYWVNHRNGFHRQALQGSAWFGPASFDHNSYGLIVSADHTTAYLAVPGDQAIQAVTATNPAVVTPIDVGVCGPKSMAVSGTKLFYGWGCSGTGGVGVIDLTTGIAGSTSVLPAPTTGSPTIAVTTDRMLVADPDGTLLSYAFDGTNVTGEPVTVPGSGPPVALRYRRTAPRLLSPQRARSCTPMTSERWPTRRRIT